MKDIIKTLDVWVDAEKALLLSAPIGFYDGYHRGFIKALNDVKLLLRAQPYNKPLNSERAKSARIVES